MFQLNQPTIKNQVLTWSRDLTESVRRWPPPTGDDLATELLKHPEIVRLCDWDRLEQKDWQQLLARCPQCAAYCPTLDWQDEDGWALLLSQCPEYAASCKVLDSMSGDQWMLILLKQPSLCDRCNWRRLTGRNWARILKKHPEWEAHCRFTGFSCEDWTALLCALPKYAAKCPEGILTSSARALVIAKHPKLANGKACRWLADGILPSDWAKVLWHQPTLAECCKCWDAFLPNDWLELLIRQPEFQERCMIGSKMLECLPKKSIERLLKRRPEVSGCFPSDKLAAKLRRTGGSAGHGRIGGTCMAW